MMSLRSLNDSAKSTSLHRHGSSLLSRAGVFLNSVDITISHQHGLPASAPPPRPPKITSKLFSFFLHHHCPNSSFCYRQPVCASVTIPVFTPGKDKKITFQNAKAYPWHTSRFNPGSLPSAHMVRSKPTCRSLSEPF